MSANTIRPYYDVVVVGAGPAGMAAASSCATAGLNTVLFDDQPSAGGQIYRAITRTPHRRGTVLGAEYWAGSDLVRTLMSSGAQIVPGTTAWNLTADRAMALSVAGRTHELSADRVILATGALERPFPFPGWTLPDVMSAGAAQILLKSSGIVCAGRIVLAGSGPLLWLLAFQYLEAGAKIDLILDTTPEINRLRALRYLPEFLMTPYFGQGVELLRRVRRAVPIVRRVTALQALGERKLNCVSYRVGRGGYRKVKCDALLVHQGVVPNTQLAMLAEVPHRWSELRACWEAVVDDHGVSAQEGILVAGDGAGIEGARAAALRGRLAAAAVIRDLCHGRAVQDEGWTLRELRTVRKGRRFLDVLFRPGDVFRRAQGSTVVCRCEEVTARQVQEATALGCQGPNQAKFFTRCGMGPCQGRLCGLTVTEMMALDRAESPETVGHYHVRPPIKPMPLAEIASLEQTKEALRAAKR